MPAAQALPGRIFISYRRDETAYPAGWLFDRLADHYGPDQVFKDVDSIEPGDDFSRVINAAVGSCDVLLALIGPRWLSLADQDGNRRLDDPNDFVRLEIEAALTREVRVIPILVDGATIPRQEDLPPSIAKLVRHQALELSPSRFSFDTNRLLKVLDKTLAETRAWAAVRPVASPAKPAREPPPAVRVPSERGPRPGTGSARARRPRLRWWLVAAAVVVVAVVLATVALRPQPRPLLSVPQTANLTVPRAMAALRQLGLTARSTSESSETVRTRRVIRTEPVAGTRLRRGAAITMLVSSGPRVTPLPDRIRRAGIEVGYVDRPLGPGTDLAPFLSGGSPTALQGLDWDVLQAIGKRLRVKLTPTRHQFITHFVPDLENHTVDISMSVLRDLDPEPGIGYIDYLANGTVLLVRRGDTIGSTDDLCGKTVVRPFETPPGSLVSASDHCADEGKPRIALMTCPAPAGTQTSPRLHFASLPPCPPEVDPLHLLALGRADAAIADAPLAKRSPEYRQLQVTPVKIDSGPYGIALRTGDTELRASLQSALHAVMADGTYELILSRWKLTDLALKRAS